MSREANIQIAGNFYRINLGLAAKIFSENRTRICGKSRKRKLFYIRLIIVGNLFEQFKQVEISEAAGISRQMINYYIHERQSCIKYSKEYRDMEKEFIKGKKLWRILKSKQKRRDIVLNYKRLKSFRENQLSTQ